jgi:hypothetical protein
MNYLQKYFQCDIVNDLPEIEQFGKKWVFRPNKELNPTSVIVLVVCTQLEFNIAEEKAGIDEHTFIELSENEARNLGRVWDQL